LVWLIGKGRVALGVLPTELLPAVPYVQFSIFNLAIPNIAAWGVLLLTFAVAAVARFPRIFESKE
jgi:hypothetical protein